ncbi:MAG: hypothetical protein LC624_11465, partial [Halobacteriales archaeon]|nr:hypothetical protein [Halobacteriales archaeon]
MQKTTLGALAALALMLMLAAPIASADLVPGESDVDELLEDVGEEGVAVVNLAGYSGVDTSDFVTHQGIDNVTDVQATANGLTGLARDTVNGGVATATTGAVLVLGIAADSMLQAQTIPDEAVPDGIAAMGEGRGLAFRAVDRTNELTNGADGSLAPAIQATYDAIPKPESTIGLFVLVDTNVLIDTLDFTNGILVDIHTPDVAGLQQDVTDYAVALSGSPSGILAPGSDYANAVAGSTGAFVLESQGDA